ncbi:MAG TPA: EamA/RhaT family transporter [Gammaproteobacteria bacterium]|nr:EamA/RhaT family transporter [Gammaproteobacteria bacterium]|tara:strand:- start:72 stop:980 length:909 start_codon:yes stop_codon:yes gene_type:complete
MSLKNEPRWLPIAPWLFVFVWSAGYGVAKLALESTTPLNLLALRFVGATLVLLPFVCMVRPPRPSKQAFLDLLIVATLLQLGYFLCIYVGLALGASAGVMALFAASQPVLIGMVASLVNRRIPSAKIWVGLLIGLAGASWVIFVQGQFSDGALLGAILGFVAVVFLSLGQVYDKRQRPECHPLMIYIIQYTFASVVSITIALFFEGYQTAWSPSMLGALSYLVFGNSLLGIFLMLTMVRFGAISQVTSVMFLVPGIAALIAWLVVDEVMPFAAWPGIGLAAAGVLLVLYSPQDINKTHAGSV